MCFSAAFGMCALLCIPSVVLCTILHRGSGFFDTCRKGDL